MLSHHKVYERKLMNSFWKKKLNQVLYLNSSAKSKQTSSDQAIKRDLKREIFSAIQNSLKGLNK